MTEETRKIRALAKRLDDARHTVPNEAPHFLDLGSIAYHLTLLADQIDSAPPCGLTHPDQEHLGRTACDTCGVPLF